MGFAVKRGSEKGSQKGVSKRCIERLLGEHAPLESTPYNSVTLHWSSRICSLKVSCKQYIFYSQFLQRVFLSLRLTGKTFSGSLAKTLRKRAEYGFP